MPLTISDLISRIQPKNTVLFFGSGSSIPSGAPSVGAIIERMADIYSFDKEEYSLSEITSLVEQTRSRKEMINTLRSLFKNVRPTGSLLNLPLYEWKNIYTTNYDNLIEDVYRNKGKDLTVYSSNFDFTLQDTPEATKLFKLHGTIDKDTVDGNNSKIIISERDYDSTSEYRDKLYSAFENDLSNSNVLVIGNSLSDKHIRDLISRIVDINNKCQAPASIYLLLFERDENRALLQERRGIKVAFGGIDDFFVELHKKIDPSASVYSCTGEPLDVAPTLHPVTIDVEHSIQKSIKDASAMFNGWPASYADIAANITFRRTLYNDIYAAINNDETLCVVLLGASGTGKTTLAKQLLHGKYKENVYCWEHKVDHTLMSERWRQVASRLQGEKANGVLFIDNAHNHLLEINKLVEFLSVDKNINLKLILVSSRNHWNPRVKSPVIFKSGKNFVLKKLDELEIADLLNLVESSSDLESLVASSFVGFSRAERERRLKVRCESEPFVCLKNIFASEKFDDIILREYASLEDNLRQIYRLVSAMECSGINVHRQLVVRILGINVQSISACIHNLLDIIHEYTISEKDGIYGWKTRHSVIASIIARYKMTDLDEYIQLFEKVVDNIVPTYDVEIRTIRQLCAFDEGIARIPDKHVRNKLLRKMISQAPGERVPRHRLIRNLIDVNQFEKADTEIRIFEKDFNNADGPVLRYKILLLLARVERTPGILEEDRISILEEARSQAMSAAERHPDNKTILSAYCEVGIEYFKRVKDMSVFDDGMEKLRIAEEKIGDPDITNLIRHFQARISGHEYAAN